MVKSLLERAKPQLLEALEKQKVDYPWIGAEVERNLKETFFVTHLKFGTWIDVRSLWMQATKELADTPWECFEEL